MFAIILLWVLLVVAIGAWARAWGRDFLAYSLLSLFLSPVIGAIALLIRGPLVVPESTQSYSAKPKWDRQSMNAKLHAKLKKHRICPNCDRPILNGSTKCTECGAKIGWSRAEGASDLTPYVSRLPEPPKIAAEQNEDKVCPDCAETIKAAAKVCRYCGYRFDSEEAG